MKNLPTFEEFVTESAESLMDNIQAKINEIKRQIKGLPEANREKQEAILRERLRLLHEKKGKINKPMNEARDKSYEIDCDTPSIAAEVLKVLKNHFLIDAHHENYTKLVTFTSDESQSAIQTALGSLMDDCTLTIESIKN
jgi:ATP-dependent 26S proteasome regulatory subunit